MPTFDRKVMCDECPFRKAALPGWIGPHSIEDIEKVVHSEEPFICHESIEEMMVRGYEGEEIEEHGQHCVGMLRYRNAMCKRSRDPETAQAQLDLKSVPDEPMIPATKFREHHEKPLIRRKRD
jgi:hypothetical protein